MEFPGFSGRPSSVFLGRFKLLRAHAAQVTVATRAIVEADDVVGDIIRRDLPVSVDLLLDALLLQAAEEGPVSYTHLTLPTILRV